MCAALLVAGCGGGSSGGSNTTAPPGGGGAPKKATAPNAPAGLQGRRLRARRSRHRGRLRHGPPDRAALGEAPLLRARGGRLARLLRARRLPLSDGEGGRRRRRQLRPPRRRHRLRQTRRLSRSITWPRPSKKRASHMYGAMLASKSATTIESRKTAGDEESTGSGFPAPSARPTWPARHAARPMPSTVRPGRPRSGWPSRRPRRAAVRRTRRGPGSRTGIRTTKPR